MKCVQCGGEALNGNVCDSCWEESAPDSVKMGKCQACGTAPADSFDSRLCKACDEAGKFCTKCSTYKPLGDFNTNTVRGVRYWRAECRQCQRSNNAARIAARRQALRDGGGKK